MKATDPRVALTTTVFVLLDELRSAPLLGLRLGLFGSAVVVELDVELGRREVGLVVDFPVCELVGVVGVGGKGSKRET